MEYYNLLGFFHRCCGKRRNDRGLGWLASWNTSVHSCGHNTTHTHACQVSYDTHARCIFTGTMHKACVPPSPMHKACGRSVLRCKWPARPDAHIPQLLMYKACGGDAQIPRSTAAPSESLRSTSQQIVKISEYYVDFYAISW